jgi:rfaE bifunctional protein nucleotidyltransferase chain/domain
MNDKKIISQEDFQKIRQNFREQKKTIVLCHGVYDLLHYGHIEHLQEAKKQGNILVVSVTSASYVNKGPGRPYFNDKQRMTFLASLEIVDYVLLSEAITVHEVVKCVQPDVYVKGEEYASANNDITGNINSEQEIVEQYGGRIYFTKGIVYSSTKLLNNFFSALPDNIVKESYMLKEKYGSDLMMKLRKMVNDFTNLKVLVIGDIIIDEYIFCKVQGLTAKDAAMSTRYEFEERYAGGSLAIARHLGNFSNSVTLCSMMGNEPDLKQYIEDTLHGINLEIIQNKNFATPVKRRFLKRNPQRQEYDKLFSINMLLDNEQMRKIDYTNFYKKLKQILPKYDLVVVCDYGHGLLDKKALRILEENSKFLAVNCQTNSSNYGMNIITKYKHADMFVVDERELNLAFGQILTESNTLLDKLFKQLKSKYGWVTLGSKGALGNNGSELSLLSAATLHVKDTVGAGDAFYALAALAAASGMPIDLATLMSNVAGAIKTNLVGNSKPIGKVDLLKFLSTILNV